MSKKINLGMAALVAATLMVGCGTSTETNETTTPVVNETTSFAAGQLSTAHEAVKTALGENYIPNMLQEDAELISSVYGLDLSLAESFIVETPMISFNPDLFIGIEAKEGQAEAVEAALTTYKETLLNDQFQYPANLAKIAAVDVKRAGNYVFLALIGYSGEVPAQSEVADEYAITPEEEAKINEQITEKSVELTQQALTAAVEALN